LEHCKLMAGDDDVPEEVITSTASNTSSATWLILKIDPSLL
jgi:hypothetical protein